MAPSPEPDPEILERARRRADIAKGIIADLKGPEEKSFRRSTGGRSGLPWSHPDADPWADLMRAKETIGAAPPPLELRMSEPFERALKRSVGEWQRAAPAVFGQLRDLAGFPIMIDRNLPPGWAVLVDPSAPLERRVLQILRLPDGPLSWAAVGPQRLERGMPYRWVEPAPLPVCPMRRRRIRRVYVLAEEATPDFIREAPRWAVLDTDTGELVRLGEEAMLRSTFVPERDLDRDGRVALESLAEELGSIPARPCGHPDCAAHHPAGLYSTSPW